MGGAILAHESKPLTRDEVFRIAIGGQTMDFSEHFNRLSHAEQVRRMQFFADLIVSVARGMKPLGMLSSEDIVSMLTAYFGVPKTDVNDGLLYAIRSKRLVESDVTDGPYIV